MERHERDLGIDLDVIHAWGADHVVTLLEPDEVIDLGIIALADEVANRGMAWHHLPRSGQSAKDRYFEKDLARLAPKLRQALERAERIVIHATDWEGRLARSATDVLLSCQPKLSLKQALSMVKQALAEGRSKTDGLQADA